MDFYFDKSYFGTPFYLLCWDDGTSTQALDRPQGDGWLRIGSLEAREVFKLYGFTSPRFPPQRFQRFFKQEKCDTVPWDLVMPRHAYKKEVKKVVSELKQALCGQDLSYYNKYFKHQNKIFGDLQPAKIDTSKLVSIIAANEDKQGHLRSFMPQDGYARVPDYVRTGTRTGRLKVEAGPMILNVKKEHRKVLESRFPGGSVWQLDYASLEPRILLAAQGHEDVPQDIYQNVLDEYELGDVPRQVIKICVLSRIYGATDNTIEEQIKHLVDYPADVVRIVDEYFDIGPLRQKLASEFSINAGSHITNFYGRHILCDNTAPYVLLNYYVQSTGVDVCLFGFNQVTAKIKEAGIEEKIVPLYVLHDALFLDVHPDYEYLVPKLGQVGSKDIPKFENTNFYLKGAKEV